jgi:hypothetical protein
MELLAGARLRDLLDECEQLCKIIGQSVVTTKGYKKKPETDE